MLKAIGWDSVVVAVATQESEGCDDIWDDVSSREEYFKDCIVETVKHQLTTEAASHGRGTMCSVQSRMAGRREMMWMVLITWKRTDQSGCTGVDNPQFEYAGGSLPS